MRKSKFIIIKGFYTNLSEFDIENILLENFHRFVIDLQTNFWILITWLQDASLEAGSWPNFSMSHKLKLWIIFLPMGTLTRNPNTIVQSRKINVCLLSSQYWSAQFESFHWSDCSVQLDMLDSRIWFCL